MKLHQLVAAASPGDAVTNQALATRTLLRESGIAGTIAAEHVHSDLADLVQPLADFAPADDDAVLLRYSIWSAAAKAAKEVPPRRLGFLYHNITPAKLLRGHNAALEALCERGRRELGGFAGRAEVVIADSRFNARELRQVGFPEPVVVPLLLALPNPPPPRAKVPATVLTVGRVAPSKRVEDVVRTAAILRRHLLPEVQLTVVGAWDGFSSYLEALGPFANAAGLDGAVTFTGRVSDEERDRWYASSGAYLCMSEHEGFCAPLLEAMAHGLPVVARASGAVVETLGGAGLAVPGRDPALAAEATAAALTDYGLRAALASRASERLSELEPRRVGARLLVALDPLLQ